MIELRWVDREVQDLHPMTNIYPSRPREKVLQYRERTNPEEIGIQPPLWGEWQDVPTEVLYAADRSKK